MQKRKPIGILFVIILLIFTQLHAQQRSNMRFSSFKITSDTIVLDSLSIVPGTWNVAGLDSSDYRLDASAATLIITNPAALGKTVSCSYRTFNFNLSRPIAHKSTDLILPRFVNDPSANNFLPIAYSSPSQIFDSDLQGTGSISRGITVGNNQNFSLDANLNLQLAGTLAPDLKILANITDENLPIQPEGNTRYLRDFNKVFIQLDYKDILSLNAGDIELAAPQESYFFKVNRQFTGLNAQVNSKIDSANRISNALGGGISKGKYVRLSITPIHGVQGPYRLTGEQSETNIVILSGSETVYLDGSPLTRGMDNDYVIDYNLGEITFTAKHLITEHSRIIVTFEYSDQYYSRYNLFTINKFTHEKNSKLELDVNLFHEQDLKRQSISPELSDEQMLFLSTIGDATGSADYASATLINDFTANEILYHKKDTVVDGISYSPIYVYAKNSHDSVYRVTFCHVGTNQGNYLLAQSSANGKLYQWVAPVNGTPQGDYEPVVRLNTPKMSDLASVGARYTINDKLQLHTEVGFSYSDLNLFSKSDDRDNVGLAYKLNANYRTRLTNKRLQDSSWRYDLSVDYEFVHKNFNPLQTFRDVEFSRDFNLTEDYSASTSEHILQLSTGFSHPQCGTTKYSAVWLTRVGQVSAVRNRITSQHRFRGWEWNASTAYLFSADSVQKSNFLKSDNNFAKSFSHIKIGIIDNLEYNLFRETATDSIRLNSYAFNEAALYIKSNDSSKFNLFLQYLNRIDYINNNSSLALNNLANEVQASIEFAQWKHNRLKGTVTYRNDNVRDSLGAFSPEHNFIGNIDYTGKFWKGAVVINLYYEVGSGLEQKKTYTFLKVAAGQGTHVWIDYNGNGIEELNEFEPAAFQAEADYVKIWLTTNEYVNTHNCGTTQSLTLKPANVWRNKQGIRKFISMFCNTTSLRTYQKNTSQHDWRFLNPFQFDIEDSVLVSQTANFKNALGFSLPNPYFSADYTYSINQTKNLLYYGFESTKNNTHQVTFRSSPHKILIVRTLYTRSLRKNNSIGAADKNFNILAHVLDNQVTLNFPFDLSLTASCKMSYKKNVSNIEKANLYSANLTADYRMKNKGSLMLNLQYTKILYNQTINNSISYEILEGLTVGNNFLWELSYKTQLFEYLQLNIQYEGRITNDGRLIHAGTLQLKALF